MFSASLSFRHPVMHHIPGQEAGVVGLPPRWGIAPISRVAAGELVGLRGLRKPTKPGCFPPQENYTSETSRSCHARFIPTCANLARVRFCQPVAPVLGPAQSFTKPPPCPALALSGRKYALPGSEAQQPLGSGKRATVGLKANGWAGRKGSKEGGKTGKE